MCLDIAAEGEPVDNYKLRSCSIGKVVMVHVQGWSKKPVRLTQTRKENDAATTTAHGDTFITLRWFYDNVPTAPKPPAQICVLFIDSVKIHV